MKKIMLTGVVLLPLLSGCTDGTSSSNKNVVAGDSVTRQIDFAKVSLGGKLYQMNCAECHGSQGQGGPNWRQRDAEGKFPPPPLNGTGHAWHHPKKMLHYVIANGSPGGQGNMPAWGDKLSAEEIDAIIAWFQSKWPDPVYAAWQRMDQSKGQGG